jgi:hypothetical protein
MIRRPFHFVYQTKEITHIEAVQSPGNEVYDTIEGTP